MKILQVIPHYMPAYAFGGPQRVAHSLGKTLVVLGHEVHVCTTNLKNSEEDLDVAVDELSDVEGVGVYYEPTFLSRYWGFSPLLFKRLEREVAWSDIVLVHFHYQFTNWAGAFIARRQRKPYIIFAHGSFNRFGIHSKSSRRKKLYLNLVERANIARAKLIAFNAQEESRFSMFSENGCIIPNGISTDEFVEIPVRGTWRASYPDLAEKICYLYLGRLNLRQKGLDMLIPAFAELASKRADVHLVLAGPDERGGQTEAQRLVSRLGIDNDVTFTGMVEGKEKLSILRDCDAFVLASPSEGASIALLEAMYMGLPVIVTNRVGLANEIASHGCGTVVERDLTQLVDAMSTLAGNPDERAVMGLNAQHLVADRYTWDSIAKTLLRAIEQHK